MGIALTLGRLLHVWGLMWSSGESFGRMAGISLARLALALGAIRALVWRLS